MASQSAANRCWSKGCGKVVYRVERYIWNFRWWFATSELRTLCTTIRWRRSGRLLALVQSCQSNASDGRGARRRSCNDDLATCHWLNLRRVPSLGNGHDHGPAYSVVRITYLGECWRCSWTATMMLLLIGSLQRKEKKNNFPNKSSPKQCKRRPTDRWG